MSAGSWLRDDGSAIRLMRERHRVAVSMEDYALCCSSRCSLAAKNARHGHVMVHIWRDGNAFTQIGTKFSYVSIRRDLPYTRLFP